MPPIPDHLLDPIRLRVQDPIMTIHALINPRFPVSEKSTSPDRDLSLESILTLAQIAELLQLYVIFILAFIMN